MTALYHESIPNASGIYRIICIPTGKIYIGSSTDLHKRWLSHRSALQRKDHGNAKLQNAWNKYGPDAFVFDVLEFVLAPFLLEREQYWLDRIKPFGKKGFNMTPTAGSTLGRKFSSETKEKIRIANLGRKHTPESRTNMGASRRGKPSNNLGKKASLEAREKNRIAQLGNKRALGLKHTPETRKRMSENSTVKGKPAHNQGTKHTPEAIEKIRKAGLGRKRTIESRAKTSASLKIAKASSRKTLIVTDPDGKTYTVTGIRQFCQDHNLDRSTLMRVAKGQERHHKGWVARFPETDVS